MSHRQKLAMIFTMLLGGFFGLLNETLLTTIAKNNERF